MKKKALYFLTLLSFLCVDVSAQESIMGEINYGYLQKLIELAKNNYPRRKILEMNQMKAQSAIPAAKISYLDLFSGSYIYRPDDRASINVENPYAVNGAQFGINLNLGSFFQKPFLVKQAKADYEITKLESKEYETTLSNEVKSRYYTYIQQKNDLSIKTQSVQDNKVLLDDWRNKYERAEADLAVYSEAKTAYSGAVSAQMEAEVNFLRAKDALEEVIGVSLDTIQ